MFTRFLVTPRYFLCIFVSILVAICSSIWSARTCFRLILNNEFDGCSFWMEKVRAMYFKIICLVWIDPVASYSKQQLTNVYDFFYDFPRNFVIQVLNILQNLAVNYLFITALNFSQIIAYQSYQKFGYFPMFFSIPLRGTVNLNLVEVCLTHFEVVKNIYLKKNLISIFIYLDLDLVLV